VAVKFDEVGADGRLNKAASERAALEPQADDRAPERAAEAPAESTADTRGELGIEIETIPQPSLPAPSASLATAWK
jgi:hypothetical protein